MACMTSGRGSATSTLSNVYRCQKQQKWYKEPPQPLLSRYKIHSPKISSKQFDKLLGNFKQCPKSYSYVSFLTFYRIGKLKLNRMIGYWCIRLSWLARSLSTFRKRLPCQSVSHVANYITFKFHL